MKSTTNKSFLKGEYRTLIVKVGITLPQIGQQATKDNVIHMAREAEKEGFDSVWTFDKLLWPLNPQTPYRGTTISRYYSNY